MRKHASTLAILLAIVALFAVAMVLGTRQSTGDGETFIGTDSAATTHIEENHPGYTPWFQTIFEPSSGEVDPDCSRCRQHSAQEPSGSSSARCASGVASAGRLPTIRAAR